MLAGVTFEDHGLLAWCARFPERAVSELTAAGLEAGATASSVMGGPRVLGMYPSPHPNRYPMRWENGTYIPWSPAGTVPTTLTGRLRASITVEAPKRVGFGVLVQTGPRTEYAWLQEDGDLDRARPVPARPFVSLTAERLDGMRILDRIYGDAAGRMLRV